MQQKQKKSESTSKNTSSVAKMMLQRDKNRLKEQQKHAYIELLKAPRGKEYLRLLAKTTEFSQQLADIEDEIKQLELELEQEAETLPASDAFTDADAEAEALESFKESEDFEEEIEDATVAEPAIKVRWNTPKATQEMQAGQAERETQRTQVAWKNAKTDAKAVMKSYKEKQQRLFEMKRRQEAIAEEFRTAMEEFKEQLPAPDKCIGLLWPGVNAEILMRYGVIACPGTAWDSPEELVEQVQPRSEQEERQWYKGGVEYEKHFCDELLMVEIYMEAICVVYKDGNTLVIE